MTDPIVVLGLTGLGLLAWIVLSAALSIVFGDWLLARGASMLVAERAEQITWTLATLAGVVVAVLVASA
ncbi:hypothetical protein ABE488_09045 [Luteimonas sp. TWI662]|uniref:hypothetical protein n=1 Tax=Luteimonas sp. TWI662 TaxID=3136789 RepID=UPI00320AACA9